MAPVVVGLMRFGRPRQEEGPPVREAPDHAGGAQDYRAGVAGDSGAGREGVVRGCFRGGWRRRLLFGFIDVAGSDLQPVSLGFACV